ncbi:hypothetical protein [Litorimonas sp. WD9-15]|uniref:hypothetical protein n=1 Tax=Litorimonas sp. WD9-15 TaxID=3418716 RepID=UPI003D0735FA
MSGPATHTLTLPGAMLARGFWLYVWQIDTPKGEYLYVERTGDSSSPRANPPFTRMSQHLGRKKKSNALKRNLLKKAGVDAEDCELFDLIMHGPIFDEIPHIGTRDERMEKHKPLRDIVAAMEKQLERDLREAGYNVLNVVHSRKPLDVAIWKPVRQAFAEQFERLGNS